MGQYHRLLNFTKREFVRPHGLGDGAKLMKQAGGPPGSTADALHYLLAASNGRGGGDYPSSEYVGRWAGDVVAMVGDYAEPDDVPGFNASDAYNETSGDDETGEGRHESWTDITTPLREALSEALEVVYLQWNRIPLHKAIAGWRFSYRMGAGRVDQIEGVNYPIPDLLRAATKALDGRRLERDEQITLADLHAAGLGEGSPA